MTELLKVGVVGRDGRMGRAAVDWIRADDGMELVGAVGSGDEWCAIDGAAVVLEVTRAGLGLEHGLRLLKMGIRPLVGTSGMNSRDASVLHEVAIQKSLGGAVVPNFSVGFLSFSQAVEAARGGHPSACVVEAHHKRKADAPSGTAIQLAGQLGIEADRVTSLRMEGVLAIHEVRLSGMEDMITLRHESRGLAGFREGLLASLRHAASTRGVTYGLAEVMGGACKVQP